MAKRGPYEVDCSIKGCSRVAYRGFLCRKHKQLLPLGMVIEAVSEGITASSRIAHKHRKRQLAYVRKLLATQGTE